MFLNISSGETDPDRVVGYRAGVDLAVQTGRDGWTAAGAAALAGNARLRRPSARRRGDAAASRSRRRRGVTVSAPGVGVAARRDRRRSSSQVAGLDALAALGVTLDRPCNRAGETPAVVCRRAGHAEAAAAVARHNAARGVG